MRTNHHQRSIIYIYVMYVSHLCNQIKYALILRTTSIYYLPLEKTPVCIYCRSLRINSLVNSLLLYNIQLNITNKHTHIHTHTVVYIIFKSSKRWVHETSKVRERRQQLSLLIRIYILRK